MAFNAYFIYYSYYLLIVLCLGRIAKKLGEAVVAVFSAMAFVEQPCLFSSASRDPANALKVAVLLSVH